MSGHSFVTVEQDSLDDIANCVEAILRTPLGFRDDATDLGSPDYTFASLPVGADTIAENISVQEPRVDILVRESIDRLDALIDHVSIELHGRGGA